MKIVDGFIPSTTKESFAFYIWTFWS